MNELKKSVERVVRPVRADTWTKLKMREELYAHASDVYAEEFATDHKAENALARTIARLGDPAALTAEYQSVVPRSERFTAWFTERFFHQRPQESRLALAARIAGCCMVVMGGLMLLLIPSFEFSEIMAWTVRAQLQLRMCAALLVFWTADVFVLTLVASAMRDECLSGGSAVGRILRCGLLAIGASVTIELTGGWGLMLAAGGRSSIGWVWLPVSVVIALGCILGAGLTAQERRRSDPWASLQIDE
jgi:hypothetical protein